MTAWGYYKKFDGIFDKYLPERGEGETLATQIVTAMNKLIYKWYNDGDVYDNQHGLQGWCNDLSSYANWLYKHTKASEVLKKIYDIGYNEQYEELLKELADLLLDEDALKKDAETPAVESIYECDGPFRFMEYSDDDEYEEEEMWEDED